MPGEMVIAQLFGGPGDGLELEVTGGDPPPVITMHRVGNWWKTEYEVRAWEIASAKSARLYCLRAHTPEDRLLYVCEEKS